MSFPSLERIQSGEAVRGVGLISGTSADGIDAAVVRLWLEDGRLRFEQEAFICRPYPEAVREELFRCFLDDAPPSSVCVLNALLGELFAEAAEEATAAAGGGEIHFAASHGQTVWHQPEPVAIGKRSARGTLQIGEAARMAERLRVPVVSDFRQQDLAAGGQGAPLVPFLDYLLFADPHENRAIQNLGGIGNVTYLPAGGSLEQVIAFDTGPANAMIDAAAEMTSGGKLKFDEGGRYAAAAAPFENLVALLMDDDYLQQPPPKSTGRELYSSSRAGKLWEAGFRGKRLVSTMTQFTVESIAEAYRKFLPAIDRVYVAGGGACNPELVRRLREALSPTPVALLEDLGLNAESKEAVAFAVMGYETLRGRPSNVPSATGASRPVIQGKITLYS